MLIHLKAIQLTHRHLERSERSSFYLPNDWILRYAQNDEKESKILRRYIFRK